MLESYCDSGPIQCLFILGLRVSGLGSLLEGSAGPSTDTYKHYKPCCHNPSYPQYQPRDKGVMLVGYTDLKLR